MGDRYESQTNLQLKDGNNNLKNDLKNDLLLLSASRLATTAGAKQSRSTSAHQT